MPMEGQVQSGIRAGNVRRFPHGLAKPRTTRSFSTRVRSGEKDDGGEGGGGNGVVVGLRLLVYSLDRDGEKMEEVRYTWVVGRDESVVRHGDSKMKMRKGWSSTTPCYSSPPRTESTQIPWR